MDVNDLVVIILPSSPSLLGRTAVCAHYEGEPSREPMMTGEFLNSGLGCSVLGQRHRDGSGCSSE